MNTAVNTTASSFTLNDVRQQLSSLSPASLTAIAAGTVVLLNLLWVSLSSDKPMPSLPGFSYYNAWLFFTRRYDFVMGGFHKIKKDVYKAKIMQHDIVMMRGENARKVFYNDKDLSFTDGYQILMGGVPRLQDLKIETRNNIGDNLSWFQRKITHMLRKDRLTVLLPDLFADLERRMNMWPPSGNMNPFEEIYDLVFQLTARAATSCEIADDPAKVTRIAELYWKIEKGSNPRAMVFPFLPNKAVAEKNEALREVYEIFSAIVDKRKESGGTGENENKSDAIQILGDAGDSTADIVQFVLATLFAGVINTGINACWILLFLAANDVWRNKAIDEINSFIARYAPETHETANLPLAQRLAKVPPEVWEDGLPVMELIIRETIRLILTVLMLRRNVKSDINLDGAVIKRGAFMLHPTSSVHYDPEIYTNPEEFDPGRFEAGREEDKKSTYAFVGWGVGRHPCLGMRFAKLEIKIICALFLTSFEYAHVDAKGNPAVVKSSDVDKNDIFQARPKGVPPTLKYKRVRV